ncbi:hypothetical protein EYF80_021619 [Liparis tanakae]|uniref:Uncharacterized protein n=1 Tax=Liparis tanakae TaxID=230148 RepID=A0A4Z2HQL6_9TELE|nr:hypothetical protein EYF80_021619 [Liparis tanakae]
MTLAPVSPLDPSWPASLASFSGSTGERGRTYSSCEWSNRPRTRTLRRQHGSPSSKNVYENLSYFGKCGNTKSVRRYLPSAEAKGGDGDEQQEPFEERVLYLFRSGCCGTRLSPKGVTFRAFGEGQSGQDESPLDGSDVRLQ